MNIEVEIKVKIDGFEDIKKKLSICGTLKKGIRQIDEYYIPSHRDFFNQKPHPVEWLRIRTSASLRTLSPSGIRTNPDKVVFEYDRSVNKNAEGEQEYAQEYETEIGQPDEFRKILEFLDFQKVVTIDKQREYWDCGDFEVALDDVRDLGTFVEVEAKGNFADNITAKKECIKFLENLGVENVEEKSIHKGYPVLLLENIKK